MKTFSSFLSFVALVSLLGSMGMGCKSPGAYVAKDADKYDYENTEKLVLLDKAVQTSVTCSGIQKTILPPPDGRLVVGGVVVVAAGGAVRSLRDPHPVADGAVDVELVFPDGLAAMRHESIPYVDEPIPW